MQEFESISAGSETQPNSEHDVQFADVLTQGDMTQGDLDGTSS